MTSPFDLINGYRAKVGDERVEMRELWIWNDDTDDYHIATLASGGVTIFDRPNTNREDARQSVYLPGEHPFIQICPVWAYDYFWGHSMVERVIQLQALREGRLQQVMELLSRQVKPPSTLKGTWQGIPDETNYAAQVFGASLSSNDPTADVKVWAPTVPPDTWAEIREIDNSFDEMMGLPRIVQGKGEPGVRSKGQTSELARLGSARAKKQAYTLEDALDKIGTHFFKLLRQHDDTSMRDEDGQDFTAEQFTEDAMVKVDAHSSSPLFTEDQKELSFALYKAGAIDRATLIEMTDPPNRQILLERLKKLDASRAAAAEEAGATGARDRQARAEARRRVQVSAHLHF